MTAAEGTVDGLQLTSFEEKATAMAAVTKVWGESHRLSMPETASAVGQTLFDSLQLGDQPTTFEAEDAADIVTSLEAVAGGQAAPEYRASAQMMLDEFMGRPRRAPPAIQPEPSPPRQERVPVEPDPEGYVTEGHIILVGFAEILAMKRATERFGNRRVAKKFAPSLEAEITGEDLGRGHVVRFSGRAATQLYMCAERAAAYGDSIIDAEAAHLIKLGKDPRSIQRTRELLAA